MYSQTISPTAPAQSPTFEITSLRMRGNGGRWAMAHQVWYGDTYVRTFASITVARRFVKSQVA